MRIVSRAIDKDSVNEHAVVSPLLAPICWWGVFGYHGNDHYPCTILVEKEAKKAAENRDHFIQLLFKWALNLTKEAQETYDEEATTLTPNHGGA